MGFLEQWPLGSGFENRALGSNINIVSDYSMYLNLADSIPSAPTTNVTYAQYIGRAPIDIKAADINFLCGTVAISGTTWAEVGLATGNPAASAAASPTITITPVVATSIATELASLNQGQTKALSNFMIRAGSNVWALFGVNATTPPTMRAQDSGDQWGSRATKTAFRPSTNIGVAGAFTGPSSAGLLNFVFGVRVA